MKTISILTLLSLTFCATILAQPEPPAKIQKWEGTYDMRIAKMNGESIATNEAATLTLSVSGATLETQFKEIDHRSGAYDPSTFSTTMSENVFLVNLDLSSVDKDATMRIELSSKGADGDGNMIEPSAVVTIKEYGKETTLELADTHP